MNLKLKHKRLYALLVVLCLVLSVAVLLTACKDKTGDSDDNTGNNGTTNNTPTYQGGPEQGTYYYDVAGGEQTLVLTAGSFTYSGTGFSKTGTYTVDGNNMVLTFADTADGTATATIASDKLTLTYNNATMTFLKNVSYTVTFEVNGGSAVAPITVVNGKTAAKPQDPTKTGHAFLGWYTDSALTTTYAFTTPVTANVTLYAKWLAIVDGPVYNVSFDLGYEGAPTLEDVTTLNGMVYDLPENPTRSGYTFAGWWISMLEDGAKLSYEYTGTKLSADTTLFALWTPDNAEIAAPKANVSANGLSWTPVPGATSYKITLKDADGNVLNEITTVTYNYNYNFAGQIAGAYSFEIAAVGSGGKTSDVAVRYYNNKALDRVSELKIVDGKLVFGAVANAENYVLTIDCGNKLHNHDALLNGNSTYFDFSNCSMQKGGIKFSVVAIAEGYANSVPSVVLVHEQNLAAMGNVTYDAATDSFVWDAIANATAYKVVLTVGNETFTFKTAGTAFSLADYTGAVSVSVTPVADGYNSPDAATATATKTAPAKVQGLALNGTVLTWTSEAGTYVVTVNGTEYTVTETTLDLAAKLTELGLTAGTEYTVTVVATANGESSAPATLTTIYNAMSTTLTYSDKVVSWPSVIGYSNFKVRVNGGEEITVTGKNLASVVLTKAGENVIEVICTDITTDWTNASKITVTAYAVKYVTRTTDGEVTEYLAVGDTLTPPTGLSANGFNFGGWYNTPLGADDNGKEYTETTLVAAADLTLYTNWIPKSYKVTLNVDNSFVSNVTNGDKVDVTYTKDYKLPIPVSTDESKGFFVGWFNAPNGGGIKMTDDLGNSVEPYGVIGDSTLYPYFAEALSFIEKKNETTGEIAGYYVTKGLGINNRNVSEIVIPAMYNGKPIIGIADNAFHSCYNIVSVDFPNTVEYVGLGAFELCTKLLSINMYEAVPNYETPYSTYDGALMYHDSTSGETYLEVFPAAKIGEYTISDDVDVIGPGAFQNAKITKVIISKGVTTVSKNAFVNCRQLAEIEFVFGRENNVNIEDGAFADTPNVTKLVLPAKLAELENIKVFDAFEDLAIIEIEGGSEHYSSVNNLICDPYGTKLLYVPRSFKGTFEVPLGITAIDDKLFYQNPYVTKVIIGEHVESIGSDAFYGCNALAEVVVKTPRESLFTIGANAFARCANLKTLTIEGSDVSDATENQDIRIGEHAFESCSKLATVTIGENAMIFDIAASSFAYCTSLKTFTIDATATLKNIGNNAFMGCTALTQFEIHGTTESVGNSAFENCSKLSTISLGEGTGNLALGADVFKNCVSLTTIELPSSLTSFNSSLFDGCENIQNINVDENNTYLESYDGILYTKGRTEIIYYPRTRTIVDGLVDLTDSALLKIGPSVFKNNPAVVTVKIGASVKEIAKGAFENCINLTSVEFVGTNEEFVLGARAFAGCSKLTSFTLPASTETIGSYAFDHSALASFTIPANVTFIGFNAFAYTNIVSIEIPANVTFIGHGAFYNAAKLENVTFAPRTADIQIGQWDDNIAKADDVVLDSKFGTFAGTALTSFEVPATATYIGEYAFANLTALTSVTIPENAILNTIDKYAFYGTAISSIKLNEGLYAIEDYAFAGTKLTSVNIPKSVQYIRGYSFSIASLTEITFTEGSSEGIGLHIANGAFVGANLTSIHLPAQLKAFGESVDKYDYSAINVFYQLKYEGSNEFDFSTNANLATITVSPDNTMFTVVDGVLYKLQSYTDPDSGDIIRYPVRLLFSPKENLGNNGTVTVPKTVTVVDYTSFLRTKLTQIIFEEYAKDDPNYGAAKLVIGYLDSAAVNPSSPVVISTAYDETREGNSKNYTNLTLIQFPSHLTAIRNSFLNGFNNYSGSGYAPITVMKFNPDSTVRFVGNAMRNSSAIKRIELPMVSSIEQQSFYGLYGLSELVFASEDALKNSTLTDIGYRAFESCGALTSFVVPASVKTISNMAFYGCSHLTSFTVAEGSVLESIGGQAFYNMASQVEKGINFVIPATVKAVGAQAFERAKIIELTLSENLQLDAHGSLIEGCITIEKIHVPENHQTLSSYNGIVYDKNQTAIYMVPSAWNEDQFIIPDTVQVIAASMFARFKGSYVKLPAALTSIADKAFEYSNITHIEIPDNVTSIGKYAFRDCKNLHTITISPNSKLTTIGTYAFSNTIVSELNLPDSVETMGSYALGGCRQLTYFKVPASLKTLESRTFSNCTALTTVELSEGLEVIGNSAFHASGITSIVIPNSVKQIIDYAFQQCKSLKTFTCTDAAQLHFVGFSAFINCEALETVTFGPAVKSFGYNGQGKYNTFSGCTNLKEINLPAEMVKIPDGFFAGLQNLEVLTLPAQLEELGAEAFYNCPKLTTVTIPASLRTIGSGAFAYCTALKSVVFEEGSSIQIIPAGMFAECSSLASIVFPAGLVEIGDSAFAKTAFTTLNLPATLEEIGTTAFFECQKLTAIDLPDSMLRIGNEAFANCYELVTIDLNEGLDHIGTFAFANCSKITAVTIPATVASIEGNPFMGCTDLVLTLAAGNTSFTYVDGALITENGLTIVYYSPANTTASYTIPDTVVNIASGAFADSKLETIVLHARIKTITNYAFSNSKSLKNVTLPESVTDIQNSAFYGCSALETITIPASVIKLGDYAFAGCTNLSTFTLAERKDDMTVGSHLFDGCAKITQIYAFPGVKEFTPYMYAGTGVTSVVFGDNANYNVEGVFANSALESVTFGNITGIMNRFGKALFAGTKLTSIVIPEGFYEIAESAFANCTELKSVTLSANTIAKGAFENCTELTTLNFVRPSYLSSRDEFNVGVDDRAFANDSKLANTNIFDLAYQYGKEAFLNCSAVTGELNLSSKVNHIYDRAFAGMTVSKITLNGREYFIDPYAFEGLTATTEVYLSTVSNIDAYIERAGGIDNGWYNNTEAKVTFFTPNSGEAEVTLTDEELKTLEQYVSDGLIDKSMMEGITTVWLEYKASFVTLYPADSLTKEEITALDEFANNFKISSKLVGELPKMWIEYRMTLAKNLTSHPKYFTEDELAKFDELAGKMSDDIKAAFQQAWFEYKISFNETNPSKEISKEEQESVREFCKLIGLADEFADELINRWPEYKQQLAASLVVETPVLINLTDSELKALEKFCGEYGIKEGLEDIKLGWMTYKGAFTIGGKGDAEALSAEEEALVKEMIVTYGLKEELSKEYSQKLLEYKQRYAELYEKKIALNDEDLKIIGEFVKGHGLTEDDMKMIEEDLLNYKKSFVLSEAKADKTLTAEEETALIEFLTKYGLDAKLAKEYGDRFAEYRMKLVG